MERRDSKQALGGALTPRRKRRSVLGHKGDEVVHAEMSVASVDKTSVGACVSVVQGLQNAFSGFRHPQFRRVVSGLYVVCILFTIFFPPQQTKTTCLTMSYSTELIAFNVSHDALLN